MSERNGGWFLTYSGRKFYPVDPRPEEICIEDIAHHLSLVCRFGGAVVEFYSVAQHSLIVEEIKPGLQSLLHDATEAYMGDMVRPLKLSMPEYRAAEQNLWRVVCEKFALNPEMDCELKRADNVALVTEMRDLLQKSDYPWSIREQPLERKITPMPPKAAELAFLNRFEQLIHPKA